MSEGWGMLGTDLLPDERRVRSLGVAPAVRWYNDAAVPGLGGVWFGKPLVLALAGIALANERGLRPVVVANAVEALACCLAIHRLHRSGDPRLRGSQKLAAREGPRFAQAARPNFYVTQPMRQQTVQPLRALGLVESTASDRFNAYRVSDAGQRLLHATFRGANPYNSSVMAVLGQWIEGTRDTVDSDLLAQALSPTEALPPEARAILREQLVAGDARRARRAGALAWVARGAGADDWHVRAPEIDAAHWDDLHAGAAFFRLRDAALLVLQKVELDVSLAPRRRVELADCSRKLDESREALTARARAFLDGPADTSPGAMATQFARECMQAVPTELLRSLVTRDGRVLRVQGDDIVGGSAFKEVTQHYGTSRAHAAGDDDGPPPDAQEAWPPGVSHRIPNLRLLAADLDGRLDSLLRARAGAA